MKRRTSGILRGVTAAALCLAVAVSGKLIDGGNGFPQSIRSFADTQSDLQQKIADADAKIKEIEQKIAAAGTDIESNKEQQDNYWNKLVAQTFYPLTCWLILYFFYRKKIFLKV